MGLIHKVILRFKLHLKKMSFQAALWYTVCRTRKKVHLHLLFHVGKSSLLRRKWVFLRENELEHFHILFPTTKWWKFYSWEYIHFQFGNEKRTSGYGQGSDMSPWKKLFSLWRQKKADCARVNVGHIKLSKSKHLHVVTNRNSQRILKVLPANVIAAAPQENSWKLCEFKK